MKTLSALMLLLIGIAAFASLRARADDASAATGDPTEFACTYFEIDQKLDRTESLEFVHEVKSCEGAAGGVCFVPIRKLVTPLGCRELAANFGEDMGHASLEVTLWSYCDASSGAAQPVSQTATFAAESSFFHFVAEWEGRMSIVKCKRL